MKQGEIWMVDLRPTIGSEQKGRRPVVIISGNAMNDNLGVVIACPLSSSLKGYAGCVGIKSLPENGLENDSEIITFQVRCLSKNRLVRKLGVVTDGQLEMVKKGLSEILTY